MIIAHRRLAAALVALLLLGAFCAALPARVARAATPFLWTQGTQLVYGASPVVLKGTNFDNINALYAKDTENPANTIANGTPANFNVTEADYATIAANGANHVRWGFSYAHWRDHKAALYAAIDQQVSWARKYGVFLVLNLFTLPNGTSAGAYDCYEGYSGSCPFWGNATYKNAAQAMWVDLATRYKDQPAIAGYDLVNEPTPPAPNYCRTWFDLSRTYAAAVRAASPNQLIFVNTCSDPANDLQWNNPPTGAGIVWEVHDYSPMALSHNFSGAGVYPSTVSEDWWGGSCLANKAAFAGNGSGSACWALDIREMYGLTYAQQMSMPIYIGEWGATSKLQGYALFHQHKAELYRDWGVNHAHYTWAHQTIVSGGYYQWGIVQRGTPTQIDDPAKLNAVKIAWAGAFRPCWAETVIPCSSAAPTATVAAPTPQPPAEVTSTPTSAPATATATPPPATVTRTPSPVPPTATAQPPTATAQPSATSAPATATPAPTSAPTATPQPAGSLPLLSGEITSSEIVIRLARELDAGDVLSVDIRPRPLSYPSSCSPELGAAVCWAAINGELRFAKPAGLYRVIVTSANETWEWRLEGRAP